jgi:SAM-dependent methyltransferase
MTAAVERALSEADRVVRPLVEAIDVNDLSRHNAGYRAYGGDKFGRFVLDERERFAHALRMITADRPTGTVVDVGCFIPHLPVALARLGYHVKIVERYGLYGSRFQDAIGEIARTEGLEVFDLDILSDDFASLGQNDIVLLMAVVEHLNGSPRELMEKIQSILAPGGWLLFEVPNLAELSKRVQLLRGRSPLGDYGVYFDSAYPYMGHNREMTVAEVRQLLTAAGFAAEHVECYDHTPMENLGRKAQLIRRAKRGLPMRNTGESIMVKARTATQSAPNSAR